MAQGGSLFDRIRAVSPSSARPVASPTQPVLTRRSIARLLAGGGALSAIGTLVLDKGYDTWVKHLDQEKEEADRELKIQWVNRFGWDLGPCSIAIVPAKSHPNIRNRSSYFSRSGEYVARAYVQAALRGNVRPEILSSDQVVYLRKEDTLLVIGSRNANGVARQYLGPTTAPLRACLRRLRSIWPTAAA